MYYTKFDVILNIAIFFNISQGLIFVLRSEYFYLLDSNWELFECKCNPADQYVVPSYTILW